FLLLGKYLLRRGVCLCGLGAALALLLVLGFGSFERLFAELDVALRNGQRAPGFGDQPKVINGFSDLMVEVFGEAIGKHARSAVGMAALPMGIPVEIEMVLEVGDGS
ncbi:MAG: RidA family protein, partial [candidate division NC10 bacterium]